MYQSRIQGQSAKHSRRNIDSYLFFYYLFKLIFILKSFPVNDDLTLLLINDKIQIFENNEINDVIVDTLKSSFGTHLAYILYTLGLYDELNRLSIWDLNFLKLFKVLNK